MKIALLGYGKMGKTIEGLVEKNTAHQIALKISSRNLEELSLENLKNCDVAIDFSNPESVVHNIELCLKSKTPIVVGTTGWNKHLDRIAEKCQSENSALLYASNFSIGVNLFFQVNSFLSKLMEDFTAYKLSIEETHHLSKKDAPSGTAISLAQQIVESNKNYTDWQLNSRTISDSIPIYAKRQKDVKGRHCIKYISEIDEIEISHNAFSREGFALGALLASEFLIGKKGIFTMQDVLKAKSAI